VRPLQSSSRIGCPVFIRIKFDRRNDCLVVDSISPIDHHNHPVGAELSAFYVKNRQLSSSEVIQTTKLLQHGVLPRKIAATINKARESADSIGRVIPKDICNQVTLNKQVLRALRTEEEILRDNCQKQMLMDPGEQKIAFYKVYRKI